MRRFLLGAVIGLMALGFAAPAHAHGSHGGGRVGFHPSGIHHHWHGGYGRGWGYGRYGGYGRGWGYGWGGRGFYPGRWGWGYGRYGWGGRGYYPGWGYRPYPPIRPFNYNN